MPGIWITAQTAPLIANAGNSSTYDQEVNVGGNTDGLNVGAGSGFATPTGGASTAGDTTPVVITWGVLLFIAAVVYFVWRHK